MLTVDEYDLIRRKHLVDEMSQRAISRELGYARNTVAKAIANPIPPGYRLSKPRAKPAIDPVKHIIDAWLEQDKHGRPKQRHTGQRIYERLRDEHNFKGSATAVRRYIRKIKQYSQEVFMPLAFAPGEEAQVDWHEGWIEENGVQRKAQFFCMRLCYSKASFVWSYERANLESFLDGHVRAFEYFGGVPRRLAYDNLKSAVVQVGKGRDRRLNKRFRELRSWYLFDTRFCNVARGNEKGDVENLAKRSERTYLTPIPAVGALAGLGPKLLEDCRKDLDLPGPRPHQAKTRQEMFEEEKRCLLRLQEHPFPACREIGTFIDKRSLVQFETDSYSAPVRWAHHPVSVKAFVDRVEVWCEHQRVAVHPRSYDKGRYILVPEHYLMLLKIKPGSLDNARAFKGQPWGEDFDLMRRELEYRYDPDGTRKYINILLLFSKYPETHLAIALGREACRRGHKVRFFTASGLVNTYIEAREERQVLRLEKQIRRNDLIIIDELGYIPLDRSGAEHLFGFFSQCYEQTSLIVTTNLPFAEWPQIFAGDERLAGALLDRLTHHVYILDVTGDSYRLKASLKRHKKEGGETTP